MSDAIGFVISIFRSFIYTVFSYCNFTYNGYSVNLGWLSISALIFGILISSLLNLPSRFEGSEVGGYLANRYATRKVGGKIGRLPGGGV